MNDHIRIFTAGDTARILDLPRRRVLFLAEAGVVRPSVESEGRGKRRRYSRHDLLMMSVTSLLDKFGVKPSLMKIIIDQDKNDTEASNEVGIGLPSQLSYQPEALRCL